MSDEEVIDQREHDALVNDIRHLGKGKYRKTTSEVSKPPKKKVKFDKDDVLDNLVDAITSTRNVSELKSHLESIDETKKKKRKTLNKPLHRQARERVEASFAYKESKNELRSWDPIVRENRAAEQLFFPLNDPVTFFGTTIDEKAKCFTPRTEFEKKLFERLGPSAFAPAEQQEDPELLKAMNLQEAKKRTANLRKKRILISSASAKNAREAKIKSKKYHSVRKRERRKKLIKEVEDLLEKNPEAAKEKFKELEKDRAFERATLKHRGTGKWSVQLRQYASKNSGMQKLISEHLNLGRELKSKLGLEAAIASNDEESEEETDKPLTKSEMIELAAEQAQRELDAEQLSNFKIKKASENPELVDKLEELRKKMNETQVVNVQLPDEDDLLINGHSDNEEDDGFLAQAFNADDVVGEFVDEKQKLEEESGPQIIDDRLFGWGAWTGPGISEEKQAKKKEKFFKKTKGKERKDKGKKGLIIREELADASLAKLQPKDVPFPFTAVKDFEAVIRQPIGKDWNTHIAHKSLIKKSVVTKSGRIIRPMDKDDELKRTTAALFENDDEED